MKVPTIGESITEVTLSQWLKADGDYVNIDEPICEFESDKATLEFPAEASGKIIHVAAEDDDLEIGALVAKIDTSAAPPENTSKKEEEAPAAETRKETPATPEPAKASTNHATGHPSPAAGKILREADVNPDSVSGTGKDGRITKADAAAAASAPKKESAPKSPATTTTTNAGNFSRETSRKKMSRMRRTIASRLVEAKNATAMLTTFNEVDLTEIMALRKKYQEKFVAKYGVKLGFMSLFTKAVSNALLDFPNVNAIIDEDTNEFIYHDYTDISIAISTPSGLVVPPVHNTESLGLAEIELKIKELAGKARSGDLTLDEMKGGTFTITNGGIFGSMMSTPIINRPQSAILGMHTIQQRPVAVNGEVKIRPMMYLAMSYDHRVIDGSTSVTFLVRVKEQLEDPIRLFMGF